MPEATLAQFHDGLLADPAGTLARFLSLQVRGSDQARETLRWLRRELAEQPAPRPEALALGLDLLRDEDLRGPLPDLRPPSLWLFGSRDTLVPAAAAGRVETLLPTARTRVIPGAAHAPFLCHPAETEAAMRTFLSGN
jgi:pimeloyl-[acyl-carrier protein] methyl ester esterase